MALITRKNTYAAGATIVAQDFEDEFDRIYGGLSGLETTYNYLLKFSGANTALEVDQTGAGTVLDLKVSGTSKVSVNNTGQIVSTVSTGNSPLTVASTTLVTNLNADTVDGSHASDFVGATDPVITANGSGDGQIDLTGTTKLVRIINDESEQKLQLVNQTDGEVLLALAYADGAITAPKAGSDPALKSYVDAKLTTWGFLSYYEGEISTSDERPVYVFPSVAENIEFDELYVSYRNGAASGDTIIECRRYNASGVLQNTETITLPSAQSAGVPVSSLSLADTVTAGHYLRFVVTQAGGHEDVTVQAAGTQEVI